MINIIGKRDFTYVLSLLLVALSIGALITWGVKPGIDFVGGTEMEFSRTETTEISKDIICEKIDGGCDSSFTILLSETEDGKTFFVRYKNSDEAFNQKVIAAISEVDPEIQQLKTDFIGATISEQLKNNATKAVLFAVVAILLYIAWAFRKISVPVSSWYYGIGAVVALAHDIIITLGIFAVLGRFVGIEVGVPFVAALLTILGYSVNDTIVVFDRIRENVLRTRSLKDFEGLVNKSLNETIARSINTSLTVVIVLIPMILFGGETLFNFSLALLVGVIFGTYSSIFVATAIIVTIYNIQKNKVHNVSNN
jgi:preprotein translocase subunit SecF